MPSYYPLWIALPPRSTLFPYTTLFRSAMDAWITTGVSKGEADALERIWRTNDRGHEVLAAEGYEFERPCCAPDRDVEWRDRKSTRLNSSHVAISYAVFCLKKKRRAV